MSNQSSLNPDHQLNALRLAAIVNSSDDAIISKNLDGIITSWNRAAERMFGFTADEVIGKSIRVIVPADRQIEEDGVLAKIRQGIPVEHFDTIRQRKDGSMIPISLSVSPMRDATGRIVGASKIARDISERREAERLAERSSRQATFLALISAALTRSLDYEETLKTVANVCVPQIGDWCAFDILDSEGRLRRLAAAHVNPEMAELANEVQRRYGADPASPYSPEYAIRTGTPTMISTMPNEMAVGLVSYICVPMLTQDRPIGTITLATALSKRRYTNDDLRVAEDVASRAALAVENSQAYEQLRVANRLKDEFLATLSHELRTPLNAVLGYARMLRLGVVTQDKIPHALEVLERNATSLTQIVEDVLDVSRIVSGKVRLQIQPVALAKVIADAVATIQPAADAKGIRIESVVDPKVDRLSGDPERLQQVVWNLMSNAVKFTPRDGRIQVRLMRATSHVELVISDTGIGVPAAFLPHIFERFRQAEGGTTRRHGGLGLGLAIARHLVEMHGGTIDAASPGENQGSTFCIRLPVAGMHHEAQAEDHRAHPRGPQAGSAIALQDLANVRVLAVDDDEDALMMLRQILETAGATVETALSGERALEILAAERLDVMIADLGMPVMDGFDLIRLVRQSNEPGIRNVAAAALTAYARSEDRAKALRAGFDVHLAKPVDPGELVAAVAALARSRPQRVS